MEEIRSPAVEDGGRVIQDYESDMGDPQTLADFATWCKEEYPAQGSQDTKKWGKGSQEVLSVGYAGIAQMTITSPFRS
jgi:hypothetical protein